MNPRNIHRSFRQAFAATLLLLALPGHATSAPSVEELIRQGVEAERRLDPVAALPLFLAADAAKPGDAVILQKISRQYSDQSFLLSDPTEKRRLAETALSYAERAYAVDPTNAEVALSIAICHGNLDEAKEAAFKLLDINPMMYEEANPVGLKFLMSHLGICGETVRLPLVKATESLKERILKNSGMK